MKKAGEQNSKNGCFSISGRLVYRFEIAREFSVREFEELLENRVRTRKLST